MQQSKNYNYTIPTNRFNVALMNFFLINTICSTSKLCKKCTIYATNLLTYTSHSISSLYDYST